MNDVCWRIVVAQLPLRCSFFFPLLFAGLAAWWLWFSAYLTRLGAWRLRLQVPFDWFRASLFGRDISRF